MENMKLCSKCGRKLNVEMFNLRTIKGMKKPFSYCKECERKMNNERYTNVCERCGKTYKSGRKTNVCKECYNKELGVNGAERLRKWNKVPEHNPFYNVHRFGKENPNYKFDKTDEEREQQRSIEGYDLFRKKVFERDNYTCQLCGDKKGGNLVVHHLDSYDWCKEKRLSIENGITLCEECHKEFHSKYGYGKNTILQYNEFKKAS